MAGPLSVEDILAKQKAEKEAAAKPKFLSKAERAKLALEKRNAEVKGQQQRDEEEKAARIEFDKRVEEERRRAEQDRYSGNRGGGGGYGQGQGQGRREDRYERDGYGPGRYNDRNGGDRYNDRRDGHYANGNGNHQRDYAYHQQDRQPPSGPRGAPTGPRHGFGNGNGNMPPPAGPRDAYPAGPSSSSMPAPSSPKPNAPGEVAQPSDHELAVIKSRYLGGKDFNKKPRLRKEQNSKKMNFDWNAADDTTAYDQGSWRTTIQADAPGAVMLGGRLAGYDEGGQRRGQAAFDDKHADALERRRAGKGNNDDRHWSEKPLEQMKDRDWRIFREDFSISARGGHVPLPLRSWRESKISSRILDIIDEIGYKEPSPIQRQAIPIGLEYRDLIGIAKTGSGKTASFVIPMLEYIGQLPPLTDDNRHAGPYALILAPTRELAQQIEAEAKRFCQPLGYHCVSIVGGKSVEGQQFELRNGAHLIVATPGRLKDMLEGQKLVLEQCRYVVLDEADRMVDLGFEAELNLILDAMPSSSLKEDDTMGEDGTTTEFDGHRVTTLFSATMPPAVERLARKYLRKPANVTIGNAGEAVDTVELRVEFINSEEKKKNRLIEILKYGGFAAPIIVFVNQKRTADQVVKHVYAAGMSGITLHSDKTQAQREEAVQALRDGTVECLVATDVAGRGIDIPDVSLVINFQLPNEIERVVHRIGRTGRAGKNGVAISFLSESDEGIMYDLKEMISKSALSTMNPELARHDAAKQRITKEMKRKRDEQES